MFSSLFGKCKIHIVNSKVKTGRIYTNQVCYNCGENILESQDRWFSWDVEDDKDPDLLFPDVRSKYLAVETTRPHYIRDRNGNTITLALPDKHKKWINKLRAATKYSRENPLHPIPKSNIFEEIPDYYEYVSYGEFFDNDNENEDNIVGDERDDEIIELKYQIQELKKKYKHKINTYKDNIEKQDKQIKRMRTEIAQLKYNKSSVNNFF